MNPIDRVISWFAPARAVRRVSARHILNAYEAAKPTRTRRNPGDNSSADQLTMFSSAELRAQARHLDQNHDIASGVLDVLVRNTVGRGIGIEPQPKRRDGSIDDTVGDSLSALWKEWCKRPEVTQELSFGMVQRLAARAWFRDGEVLVRDHVGDVLSLVHGTQVKYSIEVFESDFLPHDYSDASKRIVQGVEKDAWGRPLYYHLYPEHPGGTLHVRGNYRRVPAQSLRHLKLVDRLHQTRGVSIFAAVVSRLNDIKDYEEAERVAARIAASMAVYIKKGGAEDYSSGTATETDSEGNQRRLFGPVVPGMVIDDLMPGEDIGMISSDRPNPNLGSFRADMLRAVSAGSRAGYSSISKNYNGTYSAQRQELVEQWSAYEIMSDEFIDAFVRPVWERFVQIAVASRRLSLPAEIDAATLADADFITPTMPWIDPLKEAAADITLVDGLLTSQQRVIRRRGGNPRDVLDQHERWQKELASRGLTPAGGLPESRPDGYPSDKPTNVRNLTGATR